MKQRIAARIKAWRLAYRLWRFRRHTERARRAGAAYTALLTGTKAKAAPANVAPGIFRKACSAVAETLVPQGLSVRRISRRSVGKRRAPRATREPSSALPAYVDPLRPMAGRVTHKPLGDTVEMLRIMGLDMSHVDDEAVRRPGRHTSRAVAKARQRRELVAA